MKKKMLLLIVSLILLCGCKARKSYVVQFDTNGSNQTIESQTLIEGENVTPPEDPVLDGSVFAGWYYNEEQFDFTTPVQEDITLTAKWKKVYTVTFDTNGSSDNISTQEVVENDCVKRPKDPSFTDHLFTGWLNNGELFDFTTKVTNNLNLTASWEPRYTVMFDSKGGSSIPNQVLAEGDPVQEPDNPTKDGYYFMGWYYQDEKFIFGNPTNESLFLEAQWKMTEEEERRIKQEEARKENYPNTDNFLYYCYTFFDKYYPGKYEGIMSKSDFNKIVLDEADGDPYYIRAKFTGEVQLQWDQPFKKFWIIVEFKDYALEKYEVMSFQVGDDYIIK